MGWSPHWRRCCAGAAARGWAGRASRTQGPSRSRTTGSPCTPSPCPHRISRTTTKASPTARCGRSTTTSWRPRSSTGIGGRPTSRSTSGSPTPSPRWPPRAPPSGCRTTSSSCSRPCCASGAPTCGSASSCTSRSRRRALHAAPLAQADHRGPAGRRPRRLPHRPAAPATSAPSPPVSPTRPRSGAASCATAAAASGSARSRSPSTPARSTRSPAPPRSRTRAKAIRAELGDPEHVLLGVDRLDYTKGIDVRLRAFEELLNEGRAADTVMVQIATPSRERVEHYQRLRAEVEQAGRAHQRRARQRGASGAALPAPVAAARAARRVLRRRRRHARHARCATA